MEFKITLLDAALVQFVQQALIKVSHYSSYLLWEASEFGLMVIHSPQIWDKEYQKQEEGQITAEQEALQDYILSATVIVWICPLDYTSNQTYVYPSYTYFQFSDEEASEDLNGWKRAYSRPLWCQICLYALWCILWRIAFQIQLFKDSQHIIPSSASPVAIFTSSFWLFYTVYLLFAFFSFSPLFLFAFLFLPKFALSPMRFARLSTKSHFLLAITKHKQQHKTSDVGQKKSKSDLKLRPRKFRSGPWNFCLNYCAINNSLLGIKAHYIIAEWLSEAR